MDMVRQFGPSVVGRPFIDDNHELRFPQSARVYAKMAREDAQVKSVLNAVTLPILRTSWWVDPNGAPDEIAAHVASDLRLTVKGGDGSPTPRSQGRISFQLHLQQALRALQFGCMFFEQVYEVGVDGREHLRKLAPRWPGTVREIVLADDGGLEGIVQRNPRTNDDVFLPVDRIVAYAHDDVGGTFEGTSALRAGYKHWRIRDELLQMEVMTLERNGMGVPVYKVSEISSNPEAEQDRGEQLAESFRSGSGAGASIPPGADLKLLGVSGQLVSPREAIAYHDSMLARAVLAHFMNLEGKGGSYALAETQSSFFIQSLQTIADWISDVATQHIVEDLVAIAYPDYDGPCPIITSDPIASRKDLTAEMLALLVDKGVVHMDPPTEEWSRKIFSMPKKQPLSESIKARRAKADMEREAGLVDPPEDKETP